MSNHQEEWDTGSPSFQNLPHSLTQAIIQYHWARTAINRARNRNTPASIQSITDLERDVKDAEDEIAHQIEVHYHAR